MYTVAKDTYVKKNECDLTEFFYFINISNYYSIPF